MSMQFTSFTDAGVACTEDYRAALDAEELARDARDGAEADDSGTTAERNQRRADTYQALCEAEMRVARLQADGHLERRRRA